MAAVLLLSAFGALVNPAWACSADGCGGTNGGASASGGDGSYHVVLWSGSGDSHAYTVDTHNKEHHYEWQWVPTCSVNGPNNADALCGTAIYSCGTPGDISYWIYYRDVDVPHDGWHLVGRQCLGPDPTFPAAQARQQVERQFRDLPLQAGAVHVQPNGRAIVNLPTIFYAETPHQLTFTVTALGRTVNLTATPQAWHWHWGDEKAAATTDNPGAPYPDETVTHRYSKPDTVQAWVTVDWVATYTIAGVIRTFQITDPVPVRSAPVTFTVREARSELVSR